MTQHGPVDPRKNAVHLSSLSGSSLPSVPDRSTEKLRIQLPSRAAEPLSSFVATSEQNDIPSSDRVVELPRSYCTSRAGKETLHAVMLESVIADLAVFARTGALPSGSKERLSLLAGVVRGTENADEAEIRSATTDVALAARAKLAHRKDSAEKELRRLSSTATPTQVKDGSAITARTINALCELRALHWLSPDTFPHAQLCELGRPALEGLVCKLQESAESALYAAQFADAESFICLNEQVLSLLQQGRLERSAPSHLSPLPRASKPTAGGQKPGLAALLRGAALGGGYAPFASSLSLELPTVILESRRAAEFLKDHQAWTTQDESPTEELLESLVDILPAAAHELATLEPARGEPFPPRTTAFVEVLSRLWYHGDKQGRVSFSVMLGPAAEHAELMQRTDYFAQLAAPYWLKLVRMAASWSHRPPAGRKTLWMDDGPELKATVARGIWMVSCTFGAQLEWLLKERTLTSSIGVEGLARDSEALRAGAERLQPQLEAAQLSQLMQRVATDLAPSLIRGFKALEHANNSALGLLQKVQQLPTLFGDSPIEKALQQFCEFVRQTTTEVSENESNSSLALLSKSFNDGDVQLFVSELDKFLALAAAAPDDSLVRTEHLRSADVLTRGYVNLITEAFNSEISGATSSAAKLEGLRTQLEHFANLREVIIARDALLGAGRKNHLSDQVVNAINAHPNISIRLLDELRHELSVGQAESTLKLVRLLTGIPGCLRRLHALHEGEVDSFRAFAARHAN